MNGPLLALSAALCAIGLLFLAVINYNLLRVRKREILTLLRMAGETEEKRALSFVDIKLAASNSVARLLDGFPFVEELAFLIARAGKDMTVADLVARMIGGSVLGLGVGLVTGARLSLLGYFFAGLFFPMLQLRRVAAARALKFESQLPEAMELIAMYVGAGRSIPQAFISAGKDLSPPCAEEFAKAAEEYSLGRPLDIALKGIGMKFPQSIGFRLLAIGVGVLGQAGGNFVEVIERIRKTMNANSSFQLKLSTLTAESRFSAMIVAAVPGLFMLGLFFISPEAINILFSTRNGNMLLVLFFFFWISGILWIMFLLRKRGI